MKTVHQLKKYFYSKRYAMIRLLENFVNIDSNSYNKKGGDRLGRLLTEKFKRLGCSVKDIEQRDFGNQLVARKAGKGKGRILILTHLDTVLKGGKAGYPFRIRSQGVASGAGVADMKGSLVSVYFVLKAFKELKYHNIGHLTILFNSDEEVGSSTSKKWIEREAKKADYCLTLEPARADGSLVIARKGAGIFEMEVKGTPAHSGIDPTKGRSAIEELAYKIISLQRLTNYKTGTTVNVGVIQGGTAHNVIPERAICRIDFRVKTMKEATRVTDEIRKIAAKKFVPGTRTKLRGGLCWPPMVKNDRTESLWGIVQKEAEKIRIKLSAVATGGASDASLVSAAGVPTIDGMGPIAGKICTPDEYLVLKSLPERTLLLALVILRLSGAN